MIKIIIFFSIFLVALIFKLFWDYRVKNKEKRVINHLKSSIIDGLIYVASALILFGFTCTGAGFVFIAIGLRWVLFDIIFNLLNGWKWNHEGESAKTDKLLKKFRKFDILIRVSPIVIGILILILCKKGLLF